MAIQATPFLMFQGEGRAAFDFYASTLPGAEIVERTLFEEGGPGPVGGLARGVLRVGALTLFMNDSPMPHAFSFTPSFSLFVTCSTEEELRALAAAFQDGGAALMPVGAYGFSRLFAWVQDRFGVSWQFNLD